MRGTEGTDRPPSRSKRRAALQTQAGQKSYSVAEVLEGPADPAVQPGHGGHGTPDLAAGGPAPFLLLGSDGPTTEGLRAEFPDGQAVEG